MNKNEFWNQYKEITKARVGLKTAGNNISTAEYLTLKAAHAEARDAIFYPLDIESLASDIRKIHHEVYTVKSKASDRQMYIQRPDKGRELLVKDEIKLKESSFRNSDLQFIICDGLSPKAIEHHALPFLTLFLNLMEKQYSRAPVVLINNGRVAIGDPIGEIFQSKAIIVLIGERPGLSSPDSMGIYFTYLPEKGLTDERRNCISNIHSGGLSYPQATMELQFLVEEAFRKKISGVYLKSTLLE